jgi:pterin-4a-carbinolamine dehydratase
MHAMNPSHPHPTAVDPWELHLLLVELKDWELIADHHMHKSIQFQNCLLALQWHALAQALSDHHGHHCLFYLGNVGSGRIEIDIMNPIEGHLVRTDLDIAVKLNALEKAVKILPLLPGKQGVHPFGGIAGQPTGGH